MSRLRQEGSALAVLGLILLGALALRLWNLDHGLPFAYDTSTAVPEPAAALPLLLVALGLRRRRSA